MKGLFGILFFCIGVMAMPAKALATDPPTCELKPAKGAATTHQVLCHGENIKLSASCSGEYTNLQWYRQSNTGTWASISGASQTNFTTGQGIYKAIFTFGDNSSCETNVDTVSYWKAYRKDWEVAACKASISGVTALPFPQAPDDGNQYSEISIPVNPNAEINYSWQIIPEPVHSEFATSSNAIFPLEGGSFMDTTLGLHKVVLTVSQQGSSCISVDTMEVTLLPLNVWADTIISYNGQPAIAVADADGGTEPYQYTWSSVDTCLTANCDSVLVSGFSNQILVSSIDENGCSIETPISVQHHILFIDSVFYVKGQNYNEAWLHFNGIQKNRLILAKRGGIPNPGKIRLDQIGSANPAFGGGHAFTDGSFLIYSDSTADSIYVTNMEIDGAYYFLDVPKPNSGNLLAIPTTGIIASWQKAILYSENQDVIESVNPDYLNAKLDFESEISVRMGQDLINPNNNSGYTDTINIHVPVVYYVVHNPARTYSNHQKAAIRDQIQTLNQNFLNSALVNGKKVRFHFGLATTFKDTTGSILPIQKAIDSIHISMVDTSLRDSGIVFINNHSMASIQNVEGNIFDQELKAISTLPDEKYLKIFIVDEIGGTEGYTGIPAQRYTQRTYFDDEHYFNRSDGIVITNRLLGGENICPECSHASYSKGKLMIHLVGEYFGLHQLALPGLDGDFVEDTPPQTSSFYGTACPPTSGEITERTIEGEDTPLVANHLSLACDNERNAFTSGQWNRTTYFIHFFRPAFLKTENVFETGIQTPFSIAALSLQGDRYFCPGHATITINAQSTAGTITVSSSDNTIFTPSSTTPNQFAGTFATTHKREVTITMTVADHPELTETIQVFVDSKCPERNYNEYNHYWVFGSGGGINFEKMSGSYFKPVPLRNPAQLNNTIPNVGRCFDALEGTTVRSFVKHPESQSGLVNYINGAGFWGGNHKQGSACNEVSGPVGIGRVYWLQNGLPNGNPNFTHYGDDKSSQGGLVMPLYKIGGVGTGQYQGTTNFSVPSFGQNASFTSGMGAGPQQNNFPVIYFTNIYKLLPFANYQNWTSEQQRFWKPAVIGGTTYYSLNASEKITGISNCASQTLDEDFVVFTQVTDEQMVSNHRVNIVILRKQNLTTSTGLVGSNVILTGFADPEDPAHSTAPEYPGLPDGMLKVSPNRRLLVMTNTILDLSTGMAVNDNSANENAQLYSYNESEDPPFKRVCQLGVNGISAISSYGASFSPSSKKLYINVNMPDIGLTKVAGIYQFDLEGIYQSPPSDPDFVLNGTKIAEIPSGVAYSLGMQLGPDNKIYLSKPIKPISGNPYPTISNPANQQLGVIHFPDLPAGGDAAPNCGLSWEGFRFRSTVNNSSFCRNGLPNFLDAVDIGAFVYIPDEYANIEICSGETVSFPFDVSVPGANVRYTVSNQSGIGGAVSCSSNCGTNFSATLTNSTQSPVTVTYTFIANDGNCDGPPVTIQIKVNPIEQIQAEPLCGPGVFGVKAVHFNYPSSSGYRLFKGNTQLEENENGQFVLWEENEAPSGYDGIGFTIQINNPNHCQASESFQILGAAAEYSNLEMGGKVFVFDDLNLASHARVAANAKVYNRGGGSLGPNHSSYVPEVTGVKWSMKTKDCKLTIHEGAVISAGCDWMWKGIEFAENPFGPLDKLTMKEGSEIRDAWKAINFSWHSGGGILDLYKANLTNNYIGFESSQFSLWSSKMEDCIISTNPAAMKMPFHAGQVYNGNTMPLMGLAGINLIYGGNNQVGGTELSIKDTRINHYFVGIRSKSQGFEAENCVFQHMGYKGIELQKTYGNLPVSLQQCTFHLDDAPLTGWLHTNNPGGFSTLYGTSGDFPLSNGGGLPLGVFGITNEGADLSFGTQNKFKGTAADPSSASASRVGILFQEKTQAIEKVEFDNMDFGVAVLADPNGSGTNSISIRENTFTNNHYGVYLDGGNLNLVLRCNQFETETIPTGQTRIGLLIGEDVSLFQDRIGGDNGATVPGSPNANRWPLSSLVWNPPTLPQPVEDFVAIENQSVNDIDYWTYDNEFFQVVNNTNGGSIFPKTLDPNTSTYVYSALDLCQRSGNNCGEADINLCISAVQSNNACPGYTLPNEVDWVRACEGSVVDIVDWPIYVPKPALPLSEILANNQAIEIQPDLQLGTGKPNPAHKKVEIPYFVPEKSGKTELWITEVSTGKLIETRLIHAVGRGMEEIDLSAYGNGVYAYRLIPEKGKASPSLKFVVIR